jgi:transcriptional regulator with XRE-family HTH domain
MTDPGPEHLGAVPFAGYLMRDYEHLVATLAASRDSQGISLRALAEHTGCGPATLSENLRGIHRMDALTAVQVAQALGYDLALIPRKDTP